MSTGSGEGVGVGVGVGVGDGDGVLSGTCSVLAWSFSFPFRKQWLCIVSVRPEMRQTCQSMPA